MKIMDVLADLQTSLNFPDKKTKETNTKESHIFRSQLSEKGSRKYQTKTALMKVSGFSLH
jgi:hypothetical protein